MIAGLIILRPLEQEEGNLGSASRSRTTAAPGSSLEGVDLNPPDPFGEVCVCVREGGGGLKIVCVCVSDLRVSSMLHAPSPEAVGAAARLNQRSQRVPPPGPKLLICQVVLQAPD